MPAKSNQFQLGNYNSWDKLVREVFPQTNDTIRNVVIPRLDEVLTGMLGYNSDWTKQNIYVSQIYDQNHITGLNCEITYIVDDFKVPNAPDEAVQTDCDAIKDSVTGDEWEVKEVTIDTASGEMKLAVEVLFEDNDDEA